MPDYDPYSQFDRIMRMNNLFAPNQQDMSSNVYSPYDSGMPRRSRMEELYQPRTTINDMYAQELGNMPRREQPGIGRSILGAIAGMGAGVRPSAVVGGQPVGFEGNPLAAMQTADAVSNAPYYRSLKDYDYNIDNLGRGAAIEDRYNDNERINANNILARENQERGIIRQEKADADRHERETQRLEISQQRADVYEFKSKPENQGKRIISPKGGFVTAIDQQGNATIVRDSQGRPISSGTLTEGELANLNQRNALERIERQGEVTGGNIALRGEANPQIFQAPDPANPLQMKTYQYNPLTQEVTEIKIPGGTAYRPGTKPAPRQPSQTEIEVIDPKTGKPNYTERRTTTYGDKPTKDNMVIMYGPDGRAYEVPTSQTDDAQARGMRFKK
jgi:hypothetical protein